MSTHVTLNTRLIPLEILLKTEFEKTVIQFIDNKISDGYYSSEINKFKFLDKSMSDFLSTSILTQAVYDDYIENFKVLLNNRISTPYYNQMIDKFELILSNTMSQHKLSNTVLFSLEDVYQFNSSKTYYQSLWNKIQAKYDENENLYLKNRTSKPYYENVIKQLQKVEANIKEIQSQYKWHIYEFIENQTDYKSVEKFELKGKIKPSTITLPVKKLDPLQIVENTNITNNTNVVQVLQKISWFKKLCLALISIFQNKKEVSKEIEISPHSEKLTDIVHHAWDNLDYKNFNLICTEKMNEIKNIINSIDFKTNHNMSMILEIKSTVCTVLPKLIETFNSVQNKDIKDEDIQNAHTILEQSLVAIENYFTTLKTEQAQEDVQDMKVYGEFIQKKYQKAGM